MARKGARASRIRGRPRCLGDEVRGAAHAGGPLPRAFAPRELERLGASARFGQLSALEIAAVPHRRRDARADDEVAEPLAGPALLRIALEKRRKGFDDLRFADVLAIERVHAVAARARAEIEVVAADSLADECDLREVRAGAPVRAAAHADGDRLTLEPDCPDDLVEPIEERGQVALRLGHREPAR